MNKIQPINLSPSFMSKVLTKGYDYAVGEKLGLFPKAETPAMSDGKLFHKLVEEKLGGGKANIAINPYDSFRTNAAKEWRDSLPEGTVIIKQERLDELNEVVARLLAHPVVKPLLEQPHTPEEVVAREVNGYNVKGIIDLSVAGKKIVVDWKFINSETFDKFESKAYWDNYDLQGATYKFLKDAEEVYFAAVENTAPYRIRVLKCDESFLDSGADKFSKVFDILKEADWRQPSFDIATVGTLTRDF